MLPVPACYFYTVPDAILLLQMQIFRQIRKIAGIFVGIAECYPYFTYYISVS
ncbi:hypothetical protein DAQ1742_04095 [Dickeya aquatica]|uniref:Uncharacterized protein n=1 Tax=Dickeya aquatica TaxID=1401087 RepID=A0A375AFI9_9GAMM|nr:hypothetical protein DAQ1742_04095 [Dickeya aquatica]